MQNIFLRFCVIIKRNDLNTLYFIFLLIQYKSNRSTLLIFNIFCWREWILDKNCKRFHESNKIKRLQTAFIIEVALENCCTAMFPTCSLSFKSRASHWIFQIASKNAPNFHKNQSSRTRFAHLLAASEMKSKQSCTLGADGVARRRQWRSLDKISTLFLPEFYFNNFQSSSSEQTLYKKMGLSRALCARFLPTCKFSNIGRRHYLQMRRFTARRAIWLSPRRRWVFPLAARGVCEIIFFRRAQHILRPATFIAESRTAGADMHAWRAAENADKSVFI